METADFKKPSASHGFRVEEGWRCWRLGRKTNREEEEGVDWKWMPGALDTKWLLLLLGQWFMMWLQECVCVGGGVWGKGNKDGSTPRRINMWRDILPDSCKGSQHFHEESMWASRRRRLTTRWSPELLQAVTPAACSPLLPSHCHLY